MKEMRLSGDRRDRVWKFFEPVPRAPRRILLAQGLCWTPGKRFKVITGAVLVGLGVSRDVRSHGLGRPSCFALCAVLILVWPGRSPSSNVGLPQRRETRKSCRRGGPTGFGAAVSLSVRRIGSTQSGPADPMVAARQWLWDSAPARAKLKAELMHLYGGDHARVGPIKWLIMWHAKNTARQFAPASRSLPAAVPLAVVAGTAALALAGLFALIGAACVSFLGMLGSAHDAGSRRRDRLVRRARLSRGGLHHPRASAEAHRRFFAEQQEHERWSGVLANRPTDRRWPCGWTTTRW